MRNACLVSQLVAMIMVLGCTVLVLIVIFNIMASVEGGVIGAFVLPHGGIALDPSQFNTTNATAKAQAWEVHNAAQEVGNIISSLKPDVILLSTPHGIAAEEDFMFYNSQHGFGTPDTDNCVCPPCCHNLSVTMDTNLTEKVVGTLKSANKVSYLSAFGPPGGDSIFPLRWGEVIPLYFSKLVLDTAKVMIISQPSRRYTDSVPMIPELQTLGYNLYRALETVPKKVLIIISSDLAHTHRKSGPYGYSDAAEPFDKACGKWAETLDSDILLVTAAEYADKALSCGYTGLVMLDGMLKTDKEVTWKSHLYANYHPSYYGMMVASFLPVG